MIFYCTSSTTKIRGKGKQQIRQGEKGRPINSNNKVNKHLNTQEKQTNSHGIMIVYLHHKIAAETPTNKEHTYKVRPKYRPE